MEKTKYTIVEPGFEFIEPPGPDNYLEFLETCTRVCYKSEDRIKPGSAEKLMNTVVKNYEHYSVTEHANCVLHVSPAFPSLVGEILSLNRLLRTHTIYTHDNGEILIVSGNMRMWKDFLSVAHASYVRDFMPVLHKKWPFFFNGEVPTVGSVYGNLQVTLMDDNPLTNQDDLTPEEMLKHMTLTCKIIGDRSMSHQLVRHRMGAYSQESQRYCNYGKKGFQFIVPPGAGVIDHRKMFVDDAIYAYNSYLRALDRGMKPEDARGLLPNCTKTEIVCTYTLDMWKHLFEHRGHNPKAQWQIRRIMLGIENKFKKLLPEIF